MQAIILAAGMGKRLGNMTKDQTKCMIPFRNRKLIDYIMDSLETVELSRIVIVTGYKGEGIVEHLGHSYKGTEIVYIDNPDYDKTNNIYSLYLAKEYMQMEDTLLLESDLVFDPTIIKELVNNPDPNLAVVERYKSWMDGTLVTLDENNHILRFIPKEDMNWDKIKKYYKTVNIYKLSRDFLKEEYLPFLEAYIHTMGENEYYEQVLRILIFLEKRNLKGHVLKKKKWYEIDDIQDLRHAEELFAPEEESLEAIQKRYGGYWEYPELIDFCYLVNPYFPPPRMIHEMKHHFKDLMSHYPAGLNVQNLMAAALFGCPEDQILTGNGAAELIPPLMSSLKGTIGLMLPTFNEYPERINSERLVTRMASGPDFHYGLKDLQELAGDCDNLLLINPDNPSGNCIKSEDLKTLLIDLNKENKKLVLDESFIDFSEDGENASFLNELSLSDFPNLVVVKSISKSYGVPGFRLGVVASSDKILLKEIRKKLPIWNINSYGEYFLQIMGKFRGDYKKACEKQRTTRALFFEQLQQISWLEVFPSQANYFLCRIKDKIGATELTDHLFRKNILIKDLSDKEGFKGENYIRIAVRNKKDNNSLLEKLKEI